jgi:hypothetical protein
VALFLLFDCASCISPYPYMGLTVQNRDATVKTKVVVFCREKLDGDENCE